MATSTRTFKIFLAMLMLTGSLALTACNTVEGAGQDIQDGGQAIENAAQDNKSN